MNNDLVVVMMEQGKGPKSETVMKMKNCPKADATEKDANSQRTEGWRWRKEMNSTPSPVMRSPTSR